MFILMSDPPSCIGKEEAGQDCCNDECSSSLRWDHLLGIDADLSILGEELSAKETEKHSNEKFSGCADPMSKNLIVTNEEQVRLTSVCKLARADENS